MYKNTLSPQPKKTLVNTEIYTFIMYGTPCFQFDAHTVRKISQPTTYFRWQLLFATIPIIEPRINLCSGLPSRALFLPCTERNICFLYQLRDIAVYIFMSKERLEWWLLVISCKSPSLLISCPKSTVSFQDPPSFPLFPPSRQYSTCNNCIQTTLFSRTKTTKVADVVYVNNVIWTVECERVRGTKAKGGAVVGRPETRVDGYSSPREKKLVL